jgi:hypothetical protein
MLFSTQKLFFLPVEDEIARVLDSGLPASVNDAGPAYTGPVAYWRGERYGVVACLVARDGRYELAETMCELRPDGLWENRGGGGCGLLHHPADRVGECWEGGRQVDWAAGVLLDGEAAATIGWAGDDVARIEARVGDSTIARVDIQPESPFGAFVIGLEPPADVELVALGRDSNPILRSDGTVESFTVTTADPF